MNPGALDSGLITFLSLRILISTRNSINIREMKKFFKLAVEISMLAFERSAKFIKNHKTETAFVAGAILGIVSHEKQKPKEESKPGTIVVFVPITTESEEKEAED